LLRTGFKIQALISEMKIEMKATAFCAVTSLLHKMIEAEVAQMIGNGYSRDGELYPVESREAICMSVAKKSVSNDRVDAKDAGNARW
jgi:hypothetical protein